MGEVVVRQERKYLVIIGILLLAAVLPGACRRGGGQFHNPVTAIEARLVHLEGWRFLGDEFVNSSVRDGLDPDALLMKSFVNPAGRQVNLVVVYHHNNRWGAHDPQVCYRSQGWELVGGEQPKELAVNRQPFRVNSFVVKKADSTNLVYYYWFSSLDRMTHSRNRQMFDMMVQGIVHGRAESGFVRFSMPLTGPADTDSRPLDDFVATFTPILQGGG